MQGASTVTVYSFRLYGRHAELPQISGFKATREAIATLGGEPLEATAEDVHESDVDERGCYRRQATGWGDLT